MTQQLSLQRFIEALSDEISQLSDEELRRAVLGWAQHLPAAQRATFLSHFIPGNTPIEQSLIRQIDVESLLTSIAELHERLERGDYFQGYGWDDEIYDERSFGDDSWADELSELFSDTDAVFMGGDLQGARTAYEQLFDILDLGDEVGVFTGAEEPVDMLDQDISESQARYLRCVYELSAQDQRATDFVQAWFSLSECGDQLSLRMIDEARPEQMPDFEAFLPGWIHELQVRLERQFTSRGRELLVEATLYHGGVEALGELARNATTAQADLYLDWLVTVLEIGDQEQGITVAREALGRLSQPGTTRARIADELAELLVAIPEEALEARRQAFRSDPKLHRLTSLYRAEQQFADPTLSMCRELEFFRNSPQAPKIPLVSQLVMLLFAGEVQAAMKLGLGSSTAGTVAGQALMVLLPYLLVSGLDKPLALPQRGSWLALLLSGTDVGEYAGLDLRSADLGRKISTSNESGEVRLASLLLQRIAGQNFSETQRAQHARTAETQIEAVVQRIVGGRNRSSYELAANLIHCRAELGYLNGRPEEAEQFVATLAAKFPRHRAFHQELVDSRRRSHVLNPDAANR